MPMYVKIPQNLSHLQISHFRAAEVDCACVFIINGALYYANGQMAKCRICCCIAKGAEEHAATVDYGCISTIYNTLNYAYVCENTSKFAALTNKPF